jgi:hypothetical protein
MNGDEGVFASRSELALQDLLMDVAAVVDATGSHGTWDILSRPDRNLGRVLEVFDSGNNLRNAAVWKDERI